jgi:hypothetical protein
VAATRPAAYCKLLTLLVPREHKVQHSNAIKNLTDEELDAMIDHLKASLEAQAQTAKVIEGTAEPVALPAPEAQSEPTPAPKRRQN